MSNEDVNIILQHCEGANTVEEVVEVLIDSNIISNTALRDLRICYEYTKRRGQGERKESATFDAAYEHGVSHRTVQRARQKFIR